MVFRVFGFHESIYEIWSFVVLVTEFCAGGNVVLLYAAKYKDVQTVVNISGRFFLVRGIEARLGKDYFKRIKENGFVDVWNRKGIPSF